MDTDVSHMYAKGRQTYPLSKKRSPGGYKYSLEDHREALVDAMKRSFGLKVENPHPMAVAVAKDGGDLSILDLAESSLELTFGSIPPRDDGDG